MWTAKIHRITKENTVSKVSFLFTSPTGEEILVEDKGFQTDEEIKRYAYHQIQAYKNVKSITLVNDDVLDLSEFASKPITPPTPEEIARRVYNEKRQALIILKQDLDLGLAEDADYQAALASTKDEIIAK